MINVIVIGGTLLFITPLLAGEYNARTRIKSMLYDEFLVILKSLNHNGYLGALLKHGHTQYLNEQKQTIAQETRTTLKRVFREAECPIEDSGGSGEPYYPFFVEVLPEHLQRARRVLREHFGTWNDVVQSVTGGTKGWGDNKRNVVRATYKSTDEPYSIVICYHPDFVPHGLLKEGCEIKVETEETISVVCS